jgi:hypothetical protein
MLQDCFVFPSLADKLSPDLRIPPLILVSYWVWEREHGSNMGCTIVPSGSGSILVLSGCRMRKNSSGYIVSNSDANTQPDRKPDSWGNAYSHTNAHTHSHSHAGDISSVANRESKSDAHSLASIGSGQPVHLWDSGFRGRERSGGNDQQ